MSNDLQALIDAGILDSDFLNLESSVVPVIAPPSTQAQAQASRPIFKPMAQHPPSAFLPFRPPPTGTPTDDQVMVTYHDTVREASPPTRAPMDLNYF